MGNVSLCYRPIMYIKKRDQQKGMESGKVSPLGKKQTGSSSGGGFGGAGVELLGVSRTDLLGGIGATSPSGAASERRSAGRSPRSKEHSERRRAGGSRAGSVAGSVLGGGDAPSETGIRADLFAR